MLDRDEDRRLSTQELFLAARFGGISPVQAAMREMSASGDSVAGQVTWI